MITPSQIETILALLKSSESDLRRLAEMAGEDPFDFYRGAELRDLDLGNQDLSGMNFDKADIRFSRLDNSLFDPGAFNGSIINDNQKWLVDEFEFYSDDLSVHDNNEILIFCRFRPRIVENALEELDTSYSEMASASGISSGALRKCRRSEVVAFDTAYSLLRAIASMATKARLWMKPSPVAMLIRQPVFQFLSGGINAPFKNVTRDRYRELVSARAEIVAIRNELYPHRRNDYRDTPESLDAMLEYYRKTVELFRQIYPNG